MGFFSRKKDKPTPAAIDPAPNVAPSPAAPGTTVDEILADLTQCVARLSRTGLAVLDVVPEHHLFDYGYIDSLRSAELLVHIEKVYGVRVVETQLVGRLSTLRALANHISTQRSGAG